MQETLCDIVPHANGWVFLLDGIQSDPYPTMPWPCAPQSKNQKRARSQKMSNRIILRMQTLKGEMRNLSVVEPKDSVEVPFRRHG